LPAKNAIERLDNKLRNARFLTPTRACHVKGVNHVLRSEPIRGVSLAGVNMQVGFAMFSSKSKVFSDPSLKVAAIDSTIVPSLSLTFHSVRWM
jgi:hypothetical protein